MPINATISIRASVGANGANNPADVSAVQSQLNGQMNPPRQRLVVDGRCGPLTRAMIADFQRVVLGTLAPDARVDPNGRTLAALNSPASESAWARMSMAPPPAAGGGASALTTIEQQRLQAWQAAIRANPQAAPAQDALAELVNGRIATLKTMLNWQGAVQYPVEMLMGIANLRRAGFTAVEIATLFADAGPQRLDAVMDAMKLVGRSGNAARVLKGLGTLATVLQVLATIAIVIDHFRAGRYGPGFAEIYSTGMGIAVPWAGFLNAVQELLYAANPNARNDTKFQAAFRFMLACDPIGAGKTAVDTAVTFIQMAINALFGTGVRGNDLDELVARMRNSPMRFWTEIGDATGDWMGDHFGEWYYRNFLQ